MASVRGVRRDTKKSAGQVIQYCGIHSQAHTSIAALLGPNFGEAARRLSAHRRASSAAATSARAAVAPVSRRSRLLAAISEIDVSTARHPPEAGWGRAASLNLRGAGTASLAIELVVEVDDVVLVLAVGALACSSLSERPAAALRRVKCVRKSSCRPA